MTNTVGVDSDLEWVRAISNNVHRLGGAWFFAESVRAYGATRGISDHLAFYASGRGGVIGDATGDIVASAFAFFPPHIVKGKYAIAMSTAEPRQCARWYAEALVEWGREQFADIDGIGDAARIGFRVADAAPALGTPLFAGWRGLPRPDDGPGAAALAFQVLREMRGDAHIHAVVAHRMTPLEAIVGKDGPERAAELFYPEPYPPVDEVAERRAAVERTTDELVADAYLALHPSEREQLTVTTNVAVARLDAPAT